MRATLERLAEELRDELLPWSLVGGCYLLFAVAVALMI